MQIAKTRGQWSTQERSQGLPCADSRPFGGLCSPACVWGRDWLWGVRRRERGDWGCPSFPINFLLYLFSLKIAHLGVQSYHHPLAGGKYMVKEKTRVGTIVGEKKGKNYAKGHFCIIFRIFTDVISSVSFLKKRKENIVSYLLVPPHQRPRGGAQRQRRKRCGR